MFNIYDGPATEDLECLSRHQENESGLSNSNASVYKSQHGIPKAVSPDQNMVNPIPAQTTAIFPNAAIAWKQPNGFYYPPNFHSKNLHFDNVDIRHLVIVPQFKPDTYTTNPTEAATRYCQQNQSGDMFNNFSAVDRQTELSDDDGSLTGYVKTTSVNEDPFFTAPVEGIECKSDELVPEKGTARASPYQYVTMVVYPEASHPYAGPRPPPAGEPAVNQCTEIPRKGNVHWGDACSTPNCFGVPLYREYSDRHRNRKPACRRHLSAWLAWRFASARPWHPITGTTSWTPRSARKSRSSWPANPTDQRSVNVFREGQVYDFFHVFATKDTEQTIHLYVGPGLNNQDVLNSVNFIRVQIEGFPFAISRPAPPAGNPGDPPILTPTYDSTTGVLTVVVNQTRLANDYATAGASKCQPASMCTWNARPPNALASPTHSPN